MRNQLNGILVLLLGFMGTTAQAQLVEPELAEHFADDPRFYELATFEQEIIEEEVTPELLKELGFDLTPRVSEFRTSASAAIDPATIVRIGLEIWKIIERNQPVLNVASIRASAVPKGVTDWRQLAGWQNPRSLIIRRVYENLFRMKVVEVSYRVLYTYGGNVRGVGKYLTNVAVIPAAPDAITGYTVNAAVAIPNEGVVNVGTSTQPVAGMQVDIEWSIQTKIKKMKESASLFIRGDGEVIDLTRGTMR